jgi:acetate---CoA ligase (ADP-forming)
MSPALHGFRGRAAVDLAALADAMSRFSRLADQVPALEEIEINPLLATPAGVRALDVRGRLSTEEAS